MQISANSPGIARSQFGQTRHDHSAREPSKRNANELTDAEKKQTEELKKRDREVRAHEAAHKAAAGKHATSGPSFTYERGPDGNNYAVGGEVQIDTSPVAGDPQATIEKARTIRRAALAPQNPSSQDQAVAAQATRMEAEARAELREKKDASPGNPNSPTNESSLQTYRQIENNQDLEGLSFSITA